jgi:predicted dehydrogenase
MKDELHIGVFGLGMGANVLALNDDPGNGLRVTSICALEQTRLREFQGRYGVQKATTEYARMLEDPDIDVVAVYTPDALHVEHCVAALDAGKHVVCTKPMATGNEGAQAIVDAVRRNRRKLMVAQTARFIPQFRDVKALLEAMRMGAPLACRGQYIHDLAPYLKLTPWRLSMPQDFMYGGGLHPIDLLRWWAGDVEEVHAYARRSAREPAYPIQDDFVLNLKFVSGCIGTVSIFCGVVRPPLPNIVMDMFCERGSITATYAEGESGVLRSVSLELPDLPIQEIAYGPETGVTYKHGDSEIRIFRSFAACIRSDAEPDPNALEGARGVAVGDAAWESIRTGKPVRVKRDF